MSQLEVDKVLPQSGTTLTLGESGDTVSVPSGATLDASNATLTLPDDSVTTAKIDDGAVTTVKIADSNITTAKLAYDPNPFRNALINGDFSIAQRGTSFTSTGSANNDDAYTLDRFYILSDGNDVIDVTQETTTVPTNQLTAIALDVETANKKFGIAQIIEQKNCVGLIGNTVNLSFKAKVSSTTKLDNVKCAIVAWSGTADTVTSDIISAWGVEGTNPTLIANATYENTPANLNVTTSYATYSVSAAVDTASTKNIIVFIWSDVTDTTAGDFLYITDVQLEPGSQASEFEFLPVDVNLARCQRYFQKYGTMRFGYSLGSGNVANFREKYIFCVTMRSAPTATLGTLSSESGSFTPSSSNQGTNADSVSFEFGTSSQANARITVDSLTLDSEL